jgi:hypothetical protein
VCEEWKTICASYIEDVAKFATSTIDPIQAEIVNFGELQTLTNNVGGKRVAQASESRTPPTFSTFIAIYLNNALKYY